MTDRDTGATRRATNGANPWRLLGWSSATALLLLPLVAMRFTSEVDWGIEDFTIAAVLLGTIGLCLELAVRARSDPAYRAGSALALLGALMILWSNLAVGIIGNEDNVYNLLFFAIVGLAILGGALVRFRPGGLAVVMGIAAAGQVAAALGGAVQDPRGATLGSALALLWAGSAALFVRAGRHHRAPG